MKQSTAQNAPTLGRVYGGDPGLIHIADGMRADMGHRLARIADEEIRSAAVAQGLKTEDEAYGYTPPHDVFPVSPQTLCPGCYMVALVNMAVALAEDNGQDLRELGATLRDAFAQIARDGAAVDLEEIAVRVDPC